MFTAADPESRPGLGQSQGQAQPPRELTPGPLRTGTAAKGRLEAKSPILASKFCREKAQNEVSQKGTPEMLRFYSYYKQATAGCCQGPRPGFWDPIGRYKWDAWHSLGGMSKEEAMAAYVAEMKKWGL
uniref:ACB domain-containing protein n=1 Tax=Malurus cyaneus samueli TaxID=2593467 RepID=A0A8C5X2J9_9PASS